MITFFACPKPFRGHIDIIQRNAIKSWTLLRPKPEIILMGSEEGIAQVCKEFDLIHIAEIDRNEYGTPLVNSIFQIAQKRASQPIVCYINSDIILMNDFMCAVKTVADKMLRYLILGQRWDVDIKENWSFALADWETDLKAFIARKSILHPPNGIDLFCFPRGMYIDIPPFAIGRLGWDNWLVWRARTKGVSVVDATNAVSIIHQNHDYMSSVIRKLSMEEANSHNGRNSDNIKWFDGRWVEIGPEAQRNISLMPDDKENLNIWAATWIIDQNGQLRRRRLTLKPSYMYYQLKCVVPLYWPAFGRIIRWLLKVRTALIKSSKRQNNKAKVT